MTLAIGASATPAAGTSTGSVAATEAALRTARGQLEDWITCPSRVTPEGKAKIKASDEKVERLKQTLEQLRKDRPARTASAEPQRAADAATAAERPAARLVLGTPLGTVIDTYA